MPIDFSSRSGWDELEDWERCQLHKEKIEREEDARGEVDFELYLEEDED